MKLSEYPYVVQDEILHNMESTDLILLSFVSKNMKKLIKSSQMKRFESIDSIVYDYRDNQPRVFLHSGLSKYDIGNCRVGEDQIRLFPVECIWKVISEKYNQYFPVACYHSNERESVIIPIHDYFLDLFGNSMEYYWRTYNYKNPIPQLQNISACVEMLGLYEPLDMKKLENFISVSPVLKFVEILATRLTEPLSPESKLYQAEFIKIIQTDITLPAVLRHFQGRRASVECTRCDTSDLSEFVNAWKSGEVFQKLEYLKVEKIPGNDQVFAQVLHAIGAKYIDAEKQPPTYSLPRFSSLFIVLDDERTTTPITSHTYVVRESDNRVASVLIQEKKLYFGVWDKTEEEFLRMVE